MQTESTSLSWWDLHLRAARGETLSPAEQQQHEAALAQHNREPLARVDLEELKRLRGIAASLVDENALVRARVDALVQETRRLEANLNQQTRDLLGVTK